MSGPRDYATTHLARFTEHTEGNEQIAIKHRIMRQLKENARLMKIKKQQQWDKTFLHLVEKIQAENATSLQEEEKYEACKAWFLADRRKISSEKQLEYDSIIYPLLPSDSQKRLELAKLHVSRYGYREVDKFNLSPADTAELKSYTNKKVTSSLKTVTKEIIASAIQEDGREGLEYLIYQFFSQAPLEYEYFYSDERIALLSSPQEKIYLHALAIRKLAMEYRNPLLSTDELAALFFAAHNEHHQKRLESGRWHQWPYDTSFMEYRLKIQRGIASNSPLNSVEIGNKQQYRSEINLYKKQIPWKDGETEIEVRHGGGYYHILEYLTGNSPGYTFDCGTEHGMYVAPQPHFLNREKMYAERNSHLHLDHPALLTARIKRKHLTKVDNSYEAGLRPEYVEFLQDIKITKYPFVPEKKPELELASPAASVASLYRKPIPALFIENPENRENRKLFYSDAHRQLVQYIGTQLLTVTTAYVNDPKPKVGGILGLFATPRLEQAHADALKTIAETFFNNENNPAVDPCQNFYSLISHFIKIYQKINEKDELKINLKNTINSLQKSFDLLLKTNKPKNLVSYPQFIREALNIEINSHAPGFTPAAK
jgi:hypothetical protein